LGLEEQLLTDGAAHVNSKRTRTAWFTVEWETKTKMMRTADERNGGEGSRGFNTKPELQMICTEVECFNTTLELQISETAARKFMRF
jgi:hypothetical protein